MTQIRLLLSPYQRSQKQGRLLALLWLLAILAGCATASAPQPTTHPQPTATRVAFNSDTAPVFQAGLRWLLDQQQADGAFGAPSPSLEATVTTLLAIRSLPAQLARPDNLTGAATAAVQSMAATAPQWLPEVDSGMLAKVVLALATHGVDTTHFAGADLGAQLQQRFDPATGLYHAESLFRHGLAIQAIGALEEPIPPAAVDIYSRLQQADGGWGWRIGAQLQPAGSSDVDTTAAALLALAAAGIRSDDTRVAAALAFLADQQTAAGGWAMDASSVPNANSTGVSLQALGALGLFSANSHGIRAAQAQQWLYTLQQPEGSFHYSPEFAGAVLMATADALPAFQWPFGD